jgi:uncharacterized protein YidB (DUF937 family)
MKRSIVMGLFDQGFSSKNGLSPAAMALLGLLAVKGFENRGKLAEMLGGLFGGGATPGTAGGGLGGLLGGLGGLLPNNASTGSVVSGGLGDLLNSFNQAGHGDVANSWVKDGPERQPAPQQIEQSIGPDVLAQLEKATGLSKDELLQRLGQALPKAVDALTPDSRIPTAQEAGAHISSGTA